MTPRVRFAPSPTGFLHVGGVRSALWNWLVARQAGGTFILRIEDTDEERNSEDWVQGIDDGLRWAGLDWDERYRQSQRGHLYEEAAAKLEAGGHTYWCDCTREAIDARAKERGGPPGYDGFCRDRGLGPGEGRALRFRTPDEGATVVPDVVRGNPTFENRTIDDPIIVRSTGKPMFLLANVVDDVDMRITHVIRGEEHLPTTPKYLLLWSALGGGELPVFAHVPVIVNEKRQKLSKRRDKVALEMYRDEGYLPEVMLNYLCLIGWSPADGRERLTLEEMVQEFRLEDVNSSPGFFDIAKLRAFNGDTIRALPVETFVTLADRWLPPAWDRAVFERVAPVVQERTFLMGEVPEAVEFLFVDEPSFDESAWTKATKGDGAAYLDAAVAGLDLLAEWTAPSIKAVLDGIAESHDVNPRKVHAVVRVAVTGRGVGLPLFESVEALGRDRTLARLRGAQARL